MSHKQHSKTEEPGGADDFFVSMMRREDPTYLSNDPRFTHKKMKQRSEKFWKSMKRNFELRYRKPSAFKRPSRASREKIKNKVR